MVPMAIPSFGGMVFAMLTWFVVPVLYDLRARLWSGNTDQRSPQRGQLRRNIYIGSLWGRFHELNHIEKNILTGVWGKAILASTF